MYFLGIRMLYWHGCWLANSPFPVTAPGSSLWVSWCLLTSVLYPSRHQNKECSSGVPGLRAPKTRSRITTPNHHPYADTLLCILGVAQILHWPLLRYVQQMSSQWVYPSLIKFCQHCKYHLLLYFTGRKEDYLFIIVFRDASLQGLLFPTLDI